MTFQIRDRFRLADEDCFLIAHSAPVEFVPGDYGFRPSKPHTACWLGYWCEFQIAENALTLEALHIFQKNRPYPVFEGVSPVAEKDGMHVYRGLKHRISYTGGLVIGRDSDPRYRLDGFLPAWSYHRVIELTFVQGRLARQDDRSAYVAELRSKLDLVPEDVREAVAEDFGNIVRRALGPEAREKAWWL